MYDRKSAQDVIKAYRRRKQMAEQLPLIYGLIIALLITAGAVLVFRLLNSGLLFFMPPATDTPAPVDTPVPSATPTATLPPLDSLGSASGDVSLLNDALTGSNSMVYTVKEGDTLAGIITQYNVSLQVVIELNPGLDPDVISVGQEILIPRSADQAPAAAAVEEDSNGYVEYTVAEGDTLASIALRYDISINSIVAENNLENADVIWVGDVLKIRVESNPSAGPSEASQPGPTSTISALIIATNTPVPNP
jgi:LysM repeat protein